MMKKLNPLQKNAALAGLSAGVVLAIGIATTPANAQTFDQEVEKINTMSATIAGIVTAMTDVAILPMGISAAMKTFRHIVLNNV
jgi:uncharacterized protein YggE